MKNSRDRTRDNILLDCSASFFPLYVLQLSKKLDLEEGRELAQEYQKDFRKLGLKIYYRVIRGRNPIKGSHHRLTDKLIFYRDIDEDDIAEFKDDFRLKSRLADLKLYRGEVIR